MQWRDQEKSKGSAKVLGLLSVGLRDCAHTAWDQTTPSRPGRGERGHPINAQEEEQEVQVSQGQTQSQTLRSKLGKTLPRWPNGPSSPHTGSHREKPPGEELRSGLSGAVAWCLQARAF